MIICLCHRVSDRDIALAVAAGCSDLEALQEQTRLGTGCGACLDCAQDILLERLSSVVQGRRVMALEPA